MLGIALSWEEYQQMQQPETSGGALFTLIPYEEARAIALERAELPEFHCCYWFGWTVDENLESYTITLKELMERIENGLAWVNPILGEHYWQHFEDIPFDLFLYRFDRFGWESIPFEATPKCLLLAREFNIDCVLRVGCLFGETDVSEEQLEYARGDLPRVLYFLNSFPSLLDKYTLDEVDQMVWGILTHPGNVVYESDDYCYEAIVKASIVPFRDYLPFVTEGQENGFYMWFDLLEWERKGPAPQYLKDVLKEILLIDNDHCQFCAYHGVNHLPTQEDRDEVLLPHLAGPIAEERNRPYAESCLLGLEM